MAMKSAILVLVAVVALLAASSASGDRGIDIQNIMNLEEAKEAQTVSLSIGNRKMVHLLTLPWDHCVPKGDPCGALDWCCGSLTCTGLLPYQKYVYGKCQ